MRRWWWVCWPLVLGLELGCQRSLPVRSELERGIDRARVALVVGQRLRSVPVRRDDREQASRPVDQSQVEVVVYSQGGDRCPPCRAFERWWEGLSEREKRGLPFRFRIETQRIPAWVMSVPTFYWQCEGKGWQHAGWKGIEEFQRVFEGSRNRSASTGPPEGEGSRMQPRGVELTWNLTAGDAGWGEWWRTGEIAINGHYAIWIPSGCQLRIERGQAQSEVVFLRPNPVLRLKWLGLRYDDVILGLKGSASGMSVILETFGEIRFARG